MVDWWWADGRYITADLLAARDQTSVVACKWLGKIAFCSIPSMLGRGKNVGD